MANKEAVEGDIIDGQYVLPYQYGLGERIFVIPASEFHATWLVAESIATEKAAIHGETAYPAIDSQGRPIHYLT